MGIQKKIGIVGFFFLLIVLLYALFSTGDDEAARKKAARKEGLSILLGGPDSGGSGRSQMNGMGIRSENADSIFDSDFYNSGKLSYEEGEGPVAQTFNEKDNPINPQTGKPYSNEAMNQFEQLRDMFPDNDLIPKRLTAEEKDRKKREDDRLANASRNVFSGNPSQDDVRYYYEQVEKQSQDRLEIITYLVETQLGEDEEMDKQYKEIYASIKEQTENLKREKETAYSRVGLR